MKTKNCGNCINFTRIKSMKCGGGICDPFDWRTSTDSGHKCPHWKALKYQRPRKIDIKDLTL